jgi:hypothetical protein
MQDSLKFLQIWISYDLGYALYKNCQLVTVNKRALSKNRKFFQLLYLSDERTYQGKISDLVSSYPDVPCF